MSWPTSQPAKRLLGLATLWPFAYVMDFFALIPRPISCERCLWLELRPSA